jgi:hypothetical protein
MTMAARNLSRVGLLLTILGGKQHLHARLDNNRLSISNGRAAQASSCATCRTQLADRCARVPALSLSFGHSAGSCRTA